MDNSARDITLVPPPDRRQSETALAIARGTARLLRSLGFSCISELPLPSGRRASALRGARAQARCGHAQADDGAFRDGGGVAHQPPGRPARARGVLGVAAKSEAVSPSS